MKTSWERHEETGVIFDCHGAQLIGVLHHAMQPADIGLLSIVAGGPQYRGGCGRQLVEMGRRLASEGIPVFRFDYRGMGDSEGEFAGFRFIEQDIEAAINEFKRQVPTLRRILIWGGCDAASAALIHAYRFDDVVGIIAANPFVSSDRTASGVKRKHYLERVRQLSFWKKVFRFEVDFSELISSDFLSSAIRKLLPATKPVEKHQAINGAINGNATGSTTGITENYIDAMLTGLTQFKGRVLFLMSGRSLISKEFDELVEADARWQKSCDAENCERWEIPDADQTFSTRESRDAMLKSVSEWANGIAFKATN